MLAEGKKFYFGVEGWAEGGDREWFEEEEWKSIDYFESSTKGTEYLNALFWFPEFPRTSAVKISSPVVSFFVSHVLFLSPNTHSNENLKSVIFFFLFCYREVLCFEAGGAQCPRYWAFFLSKRGHSNNTY